MAFNISYVYHAIDRFTPIAQKIKRNVSGLTKKIQFSTIAIKKMGGALKTLGKRTLAVAAIAGTFGIREYAKFETALLGVAKTANIKVGKELDKMGDKFTALSLKIPVGAVELLNFGQSAAQMGVKGSKNILNFAETMAKLTKTTNIMGEEGTAQLARLIQVTKGNISEVQNYASTLVALGNTSAATEGEILQFATQLSGAGALFGITGTQALGLATAMRVLGIQSEVGSSVLGRSLGVVNKAVRKGGERMRFIAKMTKIAGKDLREAFTNDAVSVVTKLGAGLEELEKQGGDVVGALAFLGLEGIRDIRVLGLLAQNTALVTEKMNLAKKAFKENTALQKEFEIQAGSLSNRFTLMVNNLKKVGKQFGIIFSPALIKVMDAITWALEGINSGLAKFTGTAEKSNFDAGKFLKESNININNLTKVEINGKIVVEAENGAAVKSATSSTTGAGGNLGFNMSNLTGATL